MQEFLVHIHIVPSSVSINIQSQSFVRQPVNEIGSAWHWVPAKRHPSDSVSVCAALWTGQEKSAENEN